jgi:hypothetical protein
MRAAGTPDASDPRRYFWMKDPEVFYPFADERLFRNVLNSLGTIAYRFGAISSNKSLPIWKAEIEQNSKVVQTAFTLFSQHSKECFDLQGCHLNLQTHGLDGAFHTDSDQVITHTLIWYVHPYEWLPEYGGYLLVGDDPHRLRAILPSQNLAVLLAATDAHCAMSPLIYAGAKPRISLALRLKRRDVADLHRAEK